MFGWVTGTLYKSLTIADDDASLPPADRAPVELALDDALDPGVVGAVTVLGRLLAAVPLRDEPPEHGLQAVVGLLRLAAILELEGVHMP